MRLHRFYVGPTRISGNVFTVTEETVLHQWKKVFRLAAGARVVLFDGSGKEFTCTIDMLSKDKADISIGESRVVPASERDVWLCVALIKKDHFEWVVEKATELGVNHIVPIIAERSEKKDLNMERLQKIAVEASEQSGRGVLPEIHGVTALEDVFSGVLAEQMPARKIVFEPEGEVFSSNDATPSGDVALFIGPEGGWSETELAFFRGKGVEIKSLGHQILRAETAAIATTSLFLLSSQ